MSKTFNLLDNISTDIENGLKKGINADVLAEKYNLSAGHLRRLFRHSYKQTLGEYIRIRKMTACLVDLLRTNSNIVEIALEYGYEYESAFIRSFKREFGITPGKYRKNRMAVYG